MTCQFSVTDQLICVSLDYLGNLTSYNFIKYQGPKRVEYVMVTLYVNVACITMLIPT